MNSYSDGEKYEPYTTSVFLCGLLGPVESWNEIDLSYLPHQVVRLQIQTKFMRVPYYIFKNKQF